MIPLISDLRFGIIASVVTSIITIVPATLAAVWSRNARTTSREVAHEVRTNGGMSDPNPNLNDHVKYQTEMMEKVVDKLLDVDDRLTRHIDHSRIMDKALAEVYLAVAPEVKLGKNEEDLE